jgi:hypothetical protein
MAVPL